MSRSGGALRWLSRYGRRIPVLAWEATLALRGGRGGLASWWQEKTQVFERWREVSEDQARYQAWLEERVAKRARLERVPEPGLFSVLTSAWDTAPDLLEEAARSVLGQSFADFEWVLVDDGSRSKRTRSALEAIATRDRRVVLARHETNTGPVGGLRRALERARGTYVVPVDADDLLAQDALAVLAHEIVNGGRPAYLYSDEEVLVLGDRVPILRTDWDPVQVAGNSYIYHLCALERARALEIGAWSDQGASWCQDWDTALRVLRAGLPVRHVPEVLYTWRAHAGSSTNRERVAPDRTNSLASQKHVLEQHLAQRGLSGRFAVEPSPLDRGAPGYRLRRLPVDPSPLLSVARTLGELRLVAKDAQAREAWVALLAPGLEVETKDWALEVQGLRELFPDAAVIGGRILDREGRVLEGAGHFGPGGVLGSPEAGHDRRDAGPDGFFLKQRSASTVPAGFCAFDPALLGSVPAEATLSFLHAWLGAAATRAQKRVVYSPFLAAVGPLAPPPGAEEARRFLEQNKDLVPDERFRGRHFGLARASA